MSARGIIDKDLDQVKNLSNKVNRVTHNHNESYQLKLIESNYQTELRYVHLKEIIIGTTDYQSVCLEKY
jgi:hypothetical protein